MSGHTPDRIGRSVDPAAPAHELTGGADTARRPTSNRLSRLARLDEVRRPVPPPDVTYERLVASALRVTASLLAAKFAAVFFVANALKLAVEVRRALGLLPYLAFQTTPDRFATVVSASAVVMATVAALWLLPAALRGVTDRQELGGRIVGLAIAAETVLWEVVRHLVAGPVVEPVWAAVAAAELLAGAALALLAL